jgi:hypothetical protein
VKELNSLATEGRGFPAAGFPAASSQAANTVPSLRPPAGFTAHLTGMSLTDLVRLQSLSEASGVFLVVSGESTGILHFSRGQLFHAETGELRGDAAAIEILAWPEGEFIRSERAAASSPTVVSTLDTLLSSARGIGGTYPARSMAETGVRRKNERSLEALAYFDASAERSAPPTRDLRAAATPGTAAAPAPRRSAKLPEGRAIASALVSRLGELLEGQGPGAEALATRVAYLARLSEVIGQAMGSGETRALRARYADSELAIQSHGDGNMFGCVISPDAH